jgi:endoglucanase
MNIRLLTALFVLVSSGALQAQTVNTLIRIDQFGYTPNARKVAVLADPQVGFDAEQAYNPGVSLQVRRHDDNTVVWSGSKQTWNSGLTHAQSGDRGWWLDFSDLTTPGLYHIFDPNHNSRSYAFEIKADVYREALKQAVRMFYYQRLGFAKSVPHADVKWTDGEAFLRPNQDPGARSRWAKTDASTARDLRGGWMDAGDVNKYTTFAEGVLLQLLQAYEANPTVFTDDFGIPESGNGVSDLLDEVKWELDFFKRCQDATGTNGFVLKVGVDNYNDVSPPSADQRPRYYLPECTSGTISGAAMFSLAGIVYSNQTNTDLQAYGADLTQRARLAWARAKVTTSNFTTFETTCDDGDIKAGDADRTDKEQLESAVLAAAYLFISTGEAEYRTFFEDRYDETDPIATTWWGPYRQPLQRAMLRYAQEPDATPSVTENILTQKSNVSYLFSIDDYASRKDLYRAFMEDWAHHWGSNNVRSNCANINLDFIEFGVNPNRADDYREVAEQYAHWMHGTNALGMCQLSNMYPHGGDYCVDEIYHTWFKDDTQWDNVLTSKGPPPGYVTGGPNKNFTYTQLSPPANQPPQKSYLQFNDGWPQASWEISEPAIYYQAAYVLMLSRLITPSVVSVPPVPIQPDWVIGASPNPTKDQVQIQLELLRPLRLQMRLLDSSQRVITTRTVSLPEGQNSEVFDLQSVPAGTYFMEVSDDKQVRKVVKIIKL